MLLPGSSIEAERSSVGVRDAVGVSKPDMSDVLPTWHLCALGLIGVKCLFLLSAGTFSKLGLATSQFHSRAIALDRE